MQTRFLLWTTWLLEKLPYLYCEIKKKMKFTLLATQVTTIVMPEVSEFPVTFFVNFAVVLSPVG